MSGIPRHVADELRREALASRLTSVDQVATRCRRAGVPEPSVSPEDGALLPLPPGDHVMTAPAPIRRRMLTADRFDAPAPGGTMFCRTWADVDHVVSVLQWLRDALETDGAALTPGHLEAELDNLKKAILERGFSGDGHISPEGITNDSPLTIPGFEHFAAWLKKQAGPVPPDWQLDLSVTRGTSHGWPTFVPANDPGSDADLMCHAWLAGRVIAHGWDLAETNEWVEKEFPLARVPSCAQMFFRTGPLAKPTAHYSLRPASERAVAALGTSTGYFCRQRQVFAVPTFINLALRAAATRVKYALRRSYSFKHGDASEFRAKLARMQGMTLFSEDISGYDRSVTTGMQRSLVGHVYSHFLSPGEIRLYNQLQRLPVLAPPLALDAEGYLYERAGMTMSGSIFTTNDGSIINAVSIAYAVSQALSIPLDVVWDRKGADWDCVVLGDDCVVGLRHPTDAQLDAYQRARAATGLKTELFRGPVFLMQAPLKNGDITGVLSRAVSKTVFRESDARSFTVDLFGLWARWFRCVSHPLADQAWRKLFATGTGPGAVLASIGVSDLKTLNALVHTPTFVATMLTEAKQIATRAALRNLLTGLGRGDISDGLSTLPATFAFLGGRFASDDLLQLFATSDPTMGAAIAPFLQAEYERHPTAWIPFIAARLEGATTADALNKSPALKFLNHKSA